jgi:hypothetical protein
MWRFGWTASARPVWDGGAETAGTRSGDALPPGLGAGSPVRSDKPPTPPSRCGDGALQAMDCGPGSRHSARFSGPQNVYGGLPEKPPIRSWRKEGRGIIAALAFLMTYHFVACQAFFLGIVKISIRFNRAGAFGKMIPRRKKPGPARRLQPCPSGGAKESSRRGDRREQAGKGDIGVVVLPVHKCHFVVLVSSTFFPRGVNKTVRPQKAACGLAPEGASSLEVLGEAKRGRP